MYKSNIEENAGLNKVVLCMVIEKTVASNYKNLCVDFD